MRESFILLAPLVAGIANHAYLKQVDSMGRNAILYFGEVTGQTWFIGLAANNNGKALSAPANQTVFFFINLD